MHEGIGMPEKPRTGEEKGTKQKSLKLFQIYTLTLKLKHECIFMKGKCE